MCISKFWVLAGYWFVQLCNLVKLVSYVFYLLQMLWKVGAITYDFTWLVGSLYIVLLMLDGRLLHTLYVLFGNIVSSLFCPWVSVFANHPKLSLCYHYFFCLLIPYIYRLWPLSLRTSPPRPLFHEHLVPEHVFCPNWWCAFFIPTLIYSVDILQIVQGVVEVLVLA